MIIGMGIDLVEIDRIRASVERFGTAFCARILHEEERHLLEAGIDLAGGGQRPSRTGTDGEKQKQSARPEDASGPEAPQAERAAVPARYIQSLAARFAAKEAAVKALGTGFAQGIGLHDVRVRSQDSGLPEITFHGKARERFLSLGGRRALLSLTHTAHAAAAVVIIEN